MIFIEDELVKVNGVVLPGLIKSIEVTEAAQIDEQEVEGSATKPKQATGYQDATVKIELIIDDTATKTKYQHLAAIRAIFRSPGQAVPQPIPIVCEDTAVHGVDKVLFKGLTHKAESKSGQLPVTLDFVEYIPQTIQATKTTSSKSSSKSQGKSQGKSSGKSSKQSSSSGASSSLSSNYKSYLSTKRGKSPAADNASTAKGANRVAQMPS